jgi:O-methyltransferase involved in polyketide biosynthesis
MIPDQSKQIISLGAGFDTTYFLMRSKYPESEFSYIEIDFPDVCRKKTEKFLESPEMQELIPGEIVIGEEIVSLCYKLLHGDLRDSQMVEEKLRLFTLKSSPTLIVSECVFAYIEANQVDELMARLAGLFDHCAAIVYDIINPNDAFGKTMVINLSLRGIQLRGIHKYPLVPSQKSRYEQWFERVQAFHMLDIYRKCVDISEKHRIESLEIMDEFEEWDLLLKHYIIVLSCKGQLFLSLTP